MHGQGAAVRRALDLLRARAGRGGLRPDPGARPRLPGHLPLGSDLRLDVRGSLVGGRALQPVSPPDAQARHGRCRGEGLRGIRGDRARVHRDALAGRPAGQGVRQRSPPRRRRAAEASGLRLRHRVHRRFHGLSRRGHRHPRGPRLGTEGCCLRRRLLAVRARLRLHGPARDGRPPGVPARAAEGGRQEAGPVRHLHAQAHPRRLALGRAHQLLDAAGRQRRG